MKIFDDLISLLNAETATQSAKLWKAEDVRPWRDVGENTLVLAKESAFELGADGKGHSATLITRDKSLVGEDSVVLIGPDIKDIGKDCAFARFAVVFAEGIDEEDDSAYKTVQSVDFVKYHIFPEGYMLRISSEGGKERVRVSKKAVAEGISFASVGRAYIDKYRQNPNVAGVRVVFVTDTAALGDVFAQIAKKCFERTAALNKILKEVMLDCNVCALKPVCDEVEELRELHFGRNKSN